MDHRIGNKISTWKKKSFYLHMQWTSPQNDDGKQYSDRFCKNNMGANNF